MINYDELLSSGIEMYNYPKFIKNFHIWKISHLMTRIIPITDKFQLPWNSVLHVLDNIQFPLTEIQDAPRIATNKFITNEKYRKWIYHNTNFLFSTDDIKQPIDIDIKDGTIINTPTEKKYIYKTAKLQQNLMNFKKEQKTNFRYLINYTDLPKMKESLTIINHNPLFRVFVLGKLRIFRRLQLILGSILNLACQLPIDKNQYIHIPLTNQVFQKGAFLRTTKVLNINTLKFPDNYHYLLMMHFLNFINIDSKTSIFSYIPEDYQKRITIIFTVGDKAIFYPLWDMKHLGETSSVYLRVVNQFNMLAMSHREEIEKIIESVPDEDIDIENVKTIDQKDTILKKETVKSILNNIKSNIKFDKNNDISENKQIDEQVDNDNDVIDEINDNNEKNIDETINDLNKENDLENDDLDPNSMKENNEYTDEDDSNNNDDNLNEDDETALDTQELIDIITRHDADYIKNKQQTQLTTGTIQAQQNVGKFKISVDTVPIDTENIESAINKDINNVLINSPSIKILNETEEEGKKRSQNYINDLDTQASLLIDQLEGLTPAQKQRLKKLAVLYKDIRIGDYTVKDWLLTPPNNTVKNNKLDFLENQIPDKSMLSSTVMTLDDEYMNKNFGRDLLAVATSFTKNGIFLTDIKVEPISTELNKLVKYSFKYEDVNGKSSTITITLPQINKRGYMFINGTKKILKKQMVNLPIIKVNNTRVSLASCHNKTLVERNTSKAYSFNAFFSALLNKLNKISDIKISTISSLIKINKPIAYEYSTLAKMYRSISIQKNNRKLYLYFDYHDRLTEFSKNDTSLLKKITYFENKYKSVVCLKENDLFGFIDVNNNINYMDSTGVILFSKKTNYLSLLNSFSDKKLAAKSLSEYTTLKIKDKNIPIGFCLAYQFGLINTLNYLKCKWIRIGKTDRRIISIYDTSTSQKTPIPGVKVKKKDQTGMESLTVGEKYIESENDIFIPFQDEYLVINRYPLIPSLIISGLSIFDTNYFKFSDMEDNATYFSLLEMKGFSANYLKAISGFFAYFIDPMTRDKLEMMGEPTNPRDLLIRSTQLLTTEDYRQASSVANHCLRSYERLNTIVYNELSRALEQYQINGGAGSKFTINPYSVIQRIVTDQAIMSVEELNPVHDIKELTGFTYTGIGGRTAQSFVLEDRKYPDDAVGKISEATVDSGKVAIVAQTSVNPTLVNTRGIFENIDPSNLDPAQALSVGALLMPCATNDDYKRLSFCSIFLSHHVPTFEGDVCRVRTGYERVLPHRSSDIFAAAAKEDGIVTHVDNKLKMIKVKYVNGDIDVFSYADKYTGSSGLIIEQQIVLRVKQGQEFKKGDILLYNKYFFKQDMYSTQVDWKHGINANVVLAERNDTLQDASGISRRLGDKFKIAPIEVVNVVIDNDTVVHDILNIGTYVEKNDVLITYEAGDAGEISFNTKDSDTLALIQNMNKLKSRAPVSGTIVKIDAYYGGPIAEMHPTLASIVKSISNYKNARNKFSKNTDAEYDNPASVPLPKGEKYKLVDFTTSTVLLQFYIRHEVNAGVGDKLVYDSSLKSVVSEVFENPLKTESGVEIDAVFGANGINRRTITSPLIVGTLQRVLEKLEKDVIDEWENNKEPI